MRDSGDWEREGRITERLDALEWAFCNIDRIDDRIVRAYVMKLKRMVDEELSRQQVEEGQSVPAPSKEFQVLDGTSSEEVHVLDKTSFQEVNVLDKTSFEEVLVGL